MLIYESLKKQIATMALLSGPLPVSANMEFAIEWMGYVDEVMVVTIKEDSKTQGWLYGNSAFLYYDYQGTLYEIHLSAFKEAVHTALEAKRFVSEPSKPPVAGFMEKFPAGKVLGYVATKDIIAISKKVQ